jgi:hypothetical protein
LVSLSISSLMTDISGFYFNKFRVFIEISYN